MQEKREIAYGLISTSSSINSLLNRVLEPLPPPRPRRLFFEKALPLP